MVDRLSHYAPQALALLRVVAALLFVEAGTMLLFNIPASTSSLPAGAGDPLKHLLPAGAMQGRTDFGNAGYGGPCPPPGKPHHSAATWV